MTLPPEPTEIALPSEPTEMALPPEARALVETFHAEQVPHRRQAEAHKRVEASLGDAIYDRKITVLAGPSGVGKTNLVDLIELDRLDRLRASGDQDWRYHFVRVTAHAPSVRRYRMQSLFRSILDEADEIARNRKQLMIGGHRSAPSDAIQQAATNVLRHRSPYVFCIDEVQHMVYGNDGSELRSHFDNLKVIADATRVPMLLVGTPEVLSVALCSSQLGRRLRNIDFLPYRSDELDAHFEAVLYFVERLPITISFEPDTHGEDFFELSVGSVGLLKELFENVLAAALTRGRSTVSWSDFEAAAVGRGRLLTLARDYREAERLLAELKGERSTLRRALGLEAEESETKSSARAAQPPSKTSTRRPGLRKLSRDPVGA